MSALVVSSVITTVTVASIVASTLALMTMFRGRKSYAPELRPLLMADVLVMTSVFTIYAVPEYVKPSGESPTLEVAIPVYCCFESFVSWYVMSLSFGAGVGQMTALSILAGLTTACIRYALGPVADALTYSLPCVVTAVVLAIVRRQSVAGYLDYVTVCHVMFVGPRSVLALASVAMALPGAYVLGFVACMSSATRFAQLLLHSEFRQKVSLLTTDYSVKDDVTLPRDTTTVTLIQDSEAF